MESVVALIAEWISFGEMFSYRSYLRLKEWQDKETLDFIRDQVWDDMTKSGPSICVVKATVLPCARGYPGLAVKQT